MASTKARSMVKAMTWRALSVAVTTAFVWLVTGSRNTAMIVMTFDIVFMTGLYYAHERAWKAIIWGKYPTDWTKYGWERKADEGIQVQGGEAEPDGLWHGRREDDRRHPVF